MFHKMTVLFVCFCLVCSLSACVYDINKVPNGTFLSSHPSPNKKYTVNIYLCEGSATVDFSIRGELVDNANRTKKNIYWSYHEDSAEVVWIDDSTVVINEHSLNVTNDIYDWRR